MFFFGGVSLIIIVFLFINYSNASLFQNEDGMFDAMIGVFRVSLQATYMIGGGLYLLKQKKS